MAGAEDPVSSATLFSTLPFAVGLDALVDPEPSARTPYAIFGDGVPLFSDEEAEPNDLSDSDLELSDVEEVTKPAKHAVSCKDAAAPAEEQKEQRRSGEAAHLPPGEGEAKNAVDVATNGTVQPCAPAPRNGHESDATEHVRRTMDGTHAAAVPEAVASCSSGAETTVQENEDMEHRPTGTLRSPATKIAMRLGRQTVFLPALPASLPHTPRSMQMPHVQTLKVQQGASQGGSSPVAAAFKLANEASPRRLALPLHSPADKLPQARGPGTPFPLSSPRAALLATHSPKGQPTNTQDVLNGTQGSLPDISLVYAPATNRSSRHTVNLMIPADQPSIVRQQEKPRTLRLKDSRSGNSTEA